MDMMNPWNMYAVMVLAHLTGATIVHSVKKWKP